MSKLLYCPNCKKDVPAGKVPDATVVHEFLSAPLDCNGEPIFDNNKLERAWNASFKPVCYWCGSTLEECRPQSKPQPTHQPEPEHKPEPKPQPKPEPQQNARPEPQHEPAKKHDEGPKIPAIGVLTEVDNETGTLWIAGMNADFQDYIKNNKLLYSLLTDNHNIRKIVFKGTFKTIWGGIFTNRFIAKKFENLQEVVMPEGVTKIPAIGFNGCTKLRKITLPHSLREIASTAFEGSESTLCEIVNLHPLIKYGEYTFKNHTLLKGKINPRQK